MLLGTGSIALSTLSISLLVAIVLFITGVVYFRHMERVFADVLERIPARHRDATAATIEMLANPYAWEVMHSYWGMPREQITRTCLAAIQAVTDRFQRQFEAALALGHRHRKEFALLAGDEHSVNAEVADPVAQIRLESGRVDAQIVTERHQRGGPDAPHVGPGVVLGLVTAISHRVSPFWAPIIHE